MNRFAFVILPLLLISTSGLAGQADTVLHKTFSGLIIDDSLGYTLPSVHLWNESTRLGSISNDSGEFSIHVRGHDTIVFSTIGYHSYVIVVSPPLNQQAVIRLKPKKYEIGEVVVRRFRNYESFKYQVLHHVLPEPAAAQSTSYIKLSSTTAALDQDRERAIKDKVESGRIGYITPLGKGVDREKAFKEKIRTLEKREEVIHAKFNRVMVGELTQLEGDQLTEFIALCNFSDEYLFETDLYTIVEAMYAKLEDYLSMADTVRTAN